VSVTTDGKTAATADDEAKTRDEIDNREVLDRYESSAITYDDEAVISNMSVDSLMFTIN